MLLKPADHEKIRAAIEAVEAKTSGEVLGVVARQSAHYWETPLVWAGGVALIVPAIAVMFGLRPATLTNLISPDWTAAHAAGIDLAVTQALMAFTTAQAVLFVLVALIVSIRPIRQLLTPSGLKREHVHKRAEEQFAAQGLHLTTNRMGVLIYASLGERRAVVIADRGVAAKVEPEEWEAVVGALIAGMKAKDPGAGFAAAIAKAGEILAAHCPRRPDDKNELPDTVIELE